MCHTLGTKKSQFQSISFIKYYLKEKTKLHSTTMLQMMVLSQLQHKSKQWVKGSQGKYIYDGTLRYVSPYLACGTYKVGTNLQPVCQYPSEKFRQHPLAVWSRITFMKQEFKR
jgi:hypothetical protein